MCRTFLISRPTVTLAAERHGQAAGAACKNVEARKTRMAGPVSFSRWFAREPADSPPLPKSLRLSELGLVELPRSTGKDQSLTADAVNPQSFAAGQGQCVV